MRKWLSLKLIGAAVLIYPECVLWLIRAGRMGKFDHLMNKDQ